MSVYIHNIITLWSYEKLSRVKNVETEQRKEHNVPKSLEQTDNRGQ